MTNDDKILELKKEIELKKKKLDKIKTFSPITTCVITINDLKKNLNALNKNQLVLLACQLHSYKTSAIELDYELSICGFSVDEWLEDVKNKIDYLSIKDEKQKLKQLEDRLTTLLSNDKKVELELEEIKNLLKN